MALFQTVVIGKYNISFGNQLRLCGYFLLLLFYVLASFTCVCGFTHARARTRTHTHTHTHTAIQVDATMMWFFSFLVITLSDLKYVLVC